MTFKFPYRLAVNFVCSYRFPLKRCQEYKSLISACKYSTNSGNIFKGETDRYNGITVDCSTVESEPQAFLDTLEDSLEKWQDEKRKCIWFKINIKDAILVPILAEKGFNFHHARGDFLMMYKWLPGELEPNLPPASHINLGVGAMVFNDKKELLAVSEKSFNYPHWKLPGGYVDQGEDIIVAAIREVKEETGVDCNFESLVSFRHTHGMMFGNSDIYILLRMKALSDKITISAREIQACKWMKIEDYTNHPHVHEVNKLMVKKAEEYKSKKIHLDFEKRTVKWATYVKEMNFLIIDSPGDNVK